MRGEWVEWILGLLVGGSHRSMSSGGSDMLLAPAGSAEHVRMHSRGFSVNQSRHRLAEAAAPRNTKPRLLCVGRRICDECWWGIFVAFKLFQKLCTCTPKVFLFCGIRSRRCTLRGGGSF